MTKAEVDVYKEDTCLEIYIQRKPEANSAILGVQYSGAQPVIRIPEGRSR
jgi:hypothetical protein